MRRPIRRLTLVLLLGLLPAALGAQNAAPAFGCGEASQRQFDFWLGRWDVTVGGNAAGTNEITLEEDGCLLHEHWVGSRGGTGQSLNWYDRGTGEWHQVWVDNQGNGLQLAGRFTEGRLTLLGTAPGPDGRPQSQRLSFTPNADGTVRQLWETSSDGGQSWQVSFDGLYRRRT
ncbi:MAG: hypothetical protein IPI38_07255 [Gemmatimonadetes bacterium]|nr:hypothetical protein [Gemmatimonadota bacterium]MBP6670439.1 hypothetical protein [Gemmatimonadales bacterium]MBK6780484.1 hypothetical protein [Gemmatimonadota bacterium]MBK7351227.1 hypothetical protein [Gemmatimonadota bacterium]MBK7715205.1 hypothetical protein [Gemmatimonadota bacterium]